VAELSADARIRDLERRLDMDPGSRLFVSLAEEYRKLGRFKQALSALQKGLLAHPGYVAAQVALGRVYVEVGQSTDAIATFTKVLVADPGNLVASRSLADIYLARGDKLESLKKLKLYRALSGDRKVDEQIATLESQVEPRPVTPTRQVKKAAEPPPAPKFHETDKSKRRPSMRPGGPAPAPLDDAFEITALDFQPGEDSGGTRSEDPFPYVPTRDTAISTPVAAVTPAPASPPETPPPVAVEAARSLAAPEPPPPMVPPPPVAAASAAPAAAATDPVWAPPPPAAPVAPPPLPPVAASSVLDAPTGPMVLPRPALMDAAPTPPPVSPAFGSEPPPAEDDPGEATAVLPASVAPTNGDGAPQTRGDGAPRALDDDAGQALFRPLGTEPSDDAFGEVPQLFQNPEDLAPAAEGGDDGDETGPLRSAPASAPPAAPASPTGRALADLYYGQGHYAEALQIYDDLVNRHPFDEELMKMRREAEARLLPAGLVHAPAAADPAVERRRSRIRVLENWLSRVQAG
jgi:tetratricopeptide (TPR) repeat protein